LLKHAFTVVVGSTSTGGYHPQQHQGYPPQQYGQGYPPQQYGQGYPPQQAPPGYPQQGYGQQQQQMYR
jgi:hypothetical protein